MLIAAMFIFVLDHSLANISCGSILFIFNVSGIEQKSDPRLLPSIFFFLFHSDTTPYLQLQPRGCSTVFAKVYIRTVCVRTVQKFV